MALRTGMSILTRIVEHMCRLLATYRAAINGVLAAAVSAGTITAAQKATVDSFLDLANAACAVLKVVSGY